MVMIVEKPRVDVALAQGVLYRGEVHIQTVILHERRDRPNLGLPGINIPAARSVRVRRTPRSKIRNSDLEFRSVFSVVPLFFRTR